MAGDRKVSLDDVTVDGSVRHYHRTDRYREVRVIAPNAKYLEELGRKLQSELLRRDVNGVQAYLQFSPIPNDRKHMMDVNIWPRARMPLIVEWT